MKKSLSKLFPAGVVSPLSRRQAKAFRCLSTFSLVQRMSRAVSRNLYQHPAARVVAYAFGAISDSSAPARFSDSKQKSPGHLHEPSFGRTSSTTELIMIFRSSCGSVKQLFLVRLIRCASIECQYQATLDEVMSLAPSQSLRCDYRPYPDLDRSAWQCGLTQDPHRRIV